MTLPWLNRGKYDAEIEQAHREAESFEAEYRTRYAAISREIRDAVIRAESARKVLDLYRNILRPDIQNLSKAATVAYQTSQSELLNVLDTQTLSIDAEYAFFDALAGYETSLADLERAIGAPLPAERRPL
jgi:outer membrane protein TolC